MSDSISNLLSKIKNGYLARKRIVSLPHSNKSEEIAKQLHKNNFLAGVEVKKDTPGKATLEMTLKYEDNNPALTEVKRISKPGLRVYSSKDKLPQVLSGLGIAIVSTSQGMMTNKEARKKGIGGEIVAVVW